MYNLLKVLGVTEEQRERFGATLGEATRRLPSAITRLAAPTLPGTYNGGDFIWRVSFADRAAAEAALASEAGAAIRALVGDAQAVRSCEDAAFETGWSGGAADARTGLYRVAMFCANRNPTPERLAAFARDTLIMPDHARTILRWELSQAATASGAMPWTHLWEQEYADRTGLEGTYMIHPVHWAHVERWFDTEYPDYLVAPQLVHTFCAIDQAILNQGPEQ
ncbi:Dabb family protein [Sphingobium estronivorans]|uniref:Dabb family protein n=1 Tax=Sphingobium estronivorans TaxID=1577690 RepID=UPI00123A1CBF|nr:Dabb family protein [Sphingobium estronivorans]